MATSLLTIEERTGKKRKLDLVGGGLPLQGANWSGQQLLSTNWNPGNREATQHILGPQELPSIWEFMWRTTVLSRAPAKFTDATSEVLEIAEASALATILRDIIRGGALLKVQWASTARNLAGPGGGFTQEEADLFGVDALSPVRQVRIGRASVYDFNFDRPDDIAATIEFVWIGEGEDQPKASDVQGEDVTAALQASINASNRSAAGIIEDIARELRPDVPNSASTFTLGQLESIANGPKDLMDSFARAAISIGSRVQRIGDLIETVRETPVAILNSIIDIANIGVVTANQFMDQLTREGPETQATRRKLSNLTQNATYFSGAQTQADLMAGTYERMAEAARRRQISTIPSAGLSRRQDQTRNDDNFEIHIPRQGETMLTIAQKYYQDPDLGDELAVANGLPSYTINPPRIPLIIPTRRNLEEANRNRV